MECTVEGLKVRTKELVFDAVEKREPMESFEWIGVDGVISQD